MRGEDIHLGQFNLGQGYSRTQIAEAGVVTAPTGSRDPHWSTGVVSFDNAVILLVTLDKTEIYRDAFDENMFWWQSQNRQTQNSPVIRSLAAGERPAYLFVRIKAQMKGLTQPFVYCGRLSTPLVEGERPVTCHFESLDFLEQPGRELASIYAWRPDLPPTHDEITRRERVSRLNPAPRTNRGQGLLLDFESRRAIELYAMRLATEHYAALGYDVSDTSNSLPYDLICTRGSQVRRVEVKGTQSMGETVELTAGEVSAAREASRSNISTDLFIVYGVTLSKPDGVASVSGGATYRIDDWLPLDEHLSPTVFRYKVHGLHRS